MEDLYARLGVSPDASFEELRSAYVEGIWNTHPDLGEGDEDLAKQLTAAYAVLADPDRRHLYDRRRRGEWVMSRSRLDTENTPGRSQAACAACGPEPVDGIPVGTTAELIVFRNGSSGNVLCEACAATARQRLTERGLSSGATAITGILSVLGFAVAPAPGTRSRNDDGPAALDPR